MPSVEGPLRISVVYPHENALIASRDSNFIFGSVGSGTAGLRINGTLVPVWPNGAFMGWVANPPADAPAYQLVAYTERDTARLTYPVRIRQPAPPGPAAPGTADTMIPVPGAPFAQLRDDSLERTVSDTDRAIIGRPTPTGTYRWFLFPNTWVRVTGYLDDKARVLLDDAQPIWVDRRDVIVPATFATVRNTTVGAPRLVPAHEWIDVEIPASTPPAYVVDEEEKSLTVTLYRAAGKCVQPTIPSGERSIQKITCQTSGSRIAYRFDLGRPVYGYLALYHDGVMTFRVRRPPVVERAHPLQGQTIVVDPGHPPGGAIGPTGYAEPEATLAVGLKVRELLEARGAHVVMTRTDPGPVALGDRPIMARRADAQALVSVHLNALPDGMNPFRSHGTGTYYFQTHSRRYATVMQQALVRELGLRDLGSFRENFALVRPTWMPAVLTEGIFIIMPDQEAAIRTPAYQAAYARGIVDGLEQFFASLAE